VSASQRGLAWRNVSKGGTMNTRTWLMIGCLLSACSDDEPVALSRLTVTEVIDEMGGTVELLGGGKVEIPPGALNEATTITITEVQDPKPMPSNMQAAGKAYAFEPYDLAFEVPVKITVPFAGESVEVRPMKLDDEKDETWETLVGASKFNNQVSIEVTSFGIFQSARPRPGSGVITLPDGAVIPADSGVDAAVGTDAGVDAAVGTDAGVDAAVGTDAGVDAAVGTDAGVDAAVGTDAGVDAGGPPPNTVVLDTGSTQTVISGGIVQLTATASGASNITVLWTQVSGPTVTLINANTLTVSFTAPDVGVTTPLVFRIEAQSGTGPVAADEVSVLITADASDQPVANAGTDQVVNEGATVQLSGSAVLAPSRVGMAMWTQVGGPLVTLTGATSFNASFTAPVTTTPTTFVFELYVQDDLGASDTDIMLVTVTTSNLLPTALAAGSTTLPETTPGTLDGTATDTDGTIVRTTWTQLVGPSAVIANANAVDTTFAPPNVTTPQTLVFQLEVEDNEGATARSTLTVTVLPVINGNVAPLAYAGADLTVSGGSGAQLNATSSDMDGSVVSTVWSQVGGTAVTLTSANTATPTFTAPAVTCAANLVFQLTITDNQGAISTDRVGVVVSGGLGSPMALGSRANFEGSTGGLFTPGTLWQRGAPTSGPAVANSGSNVWATNLAGNYPDNANEFLCLPPIPRGGTASVTLSFYAWNSVYGGDGLTLQALSPELGWTTVSYVNPAFQDGTIPAWTALGRGSLYEFIIAEVPTWATDTAHLRFVFRSTPATTAAGAYLDDIGVHSENSDPDGDGLSGIEDEVAVYGTNPFVADTDGDGVNDGAEVQAGSDPVNASEYPGAPKLMPGTVLTFEGNDCGGLTALRPVAGEATMIADTRWQCGVVASGPGRAHSGSRAWATNLTGNYASNDVAFLYLPIIDLSGVSDADLYFRLWASAYNNDGMSVQVESSPNVWIALSPATPAYNGVDAIGAPGWLSTGVQNQYKMVVLPLTAYAGRAAVKLRFSFRANGGAEAAGFYIDDLGVHDTASDPDNDGILGIRNEWASAGTNPFDADTDRDGSLDGEEVMLGTDPLNPVDFDTAPVITPPAQFNFELTNGGFAAMQTFTDGSEPMVDDRWAHGVIASGPGVATSGTRVWATVLNGNYVSDDRSYLYLPPINLNGVSGADLSFRLWSSNYGSDGLSVEARSANGTWVGVSPLTPAYNGVDGDGKPAWNSIGRQAHYALVIVPLNAFAGNAGLMLRLAFRTNGGAEAAGAYVDDLGVHRSTDDPDADGIAGVANEWLTRGTDPFVGDTDGDGVLDGAEIAAGSDPLNPSDGSVTKMLPGDVLDFELNNGGLVPLQPVMGDANLKPDTLWQWGAPGSGPSAASSGSQVWATNLTGNYRSNDVSYLFLRPIDLSGVTAADLSFRMWSSCYGSDGLSVEVQTSNGTWARLTPLTPANNGVDATGASAWTDFPGLNYTLAIVPLTGYAGNASVKLRFAFRSNGGSEAAGFYLDDVGVHSNTQDPDNDGLIGVSNEWTTYATDPLRADTDTDGANDGVEEAQGTHALDPADFPGAAPFTIGAFRNLESNNAGFATRGPLWAYGNVGNGPGAGASGARAWCTNCTGNYFPSAVEYLYSPPVVVPNVANVTFALHLWNNVYGSDGLSLEIWDNALGWQTLAVDPVRPYNATDGWGRAAWGDYIGAKYHFAAARLNAWAGQTVLLRFAFRSNGGSEAEGSYIDDFALANEASTDPDGDGLIGLLNEYNTYGTNPLVADTDGDGVNDGTEITNATNPLNPLSF